MDILDFDYKRKSESSEFVVVSGEFLKSGIALPLGTGRVRAAALRELYLYKGRTFWSKAKIAFLEIFNFAFIWRLIFPKKVFVSQSEEIFSFLKSKIDLGEPVTFSIYSGSRKYILPLFGERSGALLGVAKIYFPENIEYGNNEIVTLDYLSKVNTADFSFPEVLAKDYFRGYFMAIISSEPDLKITAGITNKHLDFLKELTQKTAEEKIFANSAFGEAIEKELSFLQAKITIEQFIPIKYFYNQAVHSLKDKTFTFSLTKREFPFFEMLCVADFNRSMFDVQCSKFFVIDWEQARFGFPPIFDLYSLIISGGRFKKGNYVELYERNIQDLFFTKNTKIQSILDLMLKFWNVEKGDAYYFFLLYLVDQLYIHLDVGHVASAERIISLFENMQENEENYEKYWILNI